MQEQSFKSRKSEPVLARIEILAILFCIFLFLCIWPLLTSFGQGSPQTLYVYFFGVLIIHALVMMLLTKYISKTSLSEEKGTNSEGPKDD